MSSVASETKATESASAGARNGRYFSIAAYALIGDCHTAALVSCDGSIDWYCPGRFDRSAVFCRILDVEKGGYMRIAPRGPNLVSRRYRQATNILETTFHASSGRTRVTDFMPVWARQASRRGYDVANAHRIVRLIEGLAGEVDLEISFKPTFDYARAHTHLSIVSGGAIARAGDKFLTLACPGMDLEADGRGGVRGSIRIKAGDRCWVSIADSHNEEEARKGLDVGSCEGWLNSTQEYWRKWASRCTYRGEYRDDVLRSALTLKMLAYEPTGAIVAAPTTSLPEEIGGIRNWDYRYSWLRDSSLILYALMTIGYQDEATDFLTWLRETQRHEPTAVPQIMYGVDGRRQLTEVHLDNLDGYMGSRPVRVGNAAYGQFQLDIYGELLTAAYVHFRTPSRRAEKKGRTHGTRPSAETWCMLRTMVELAVSQWQEPDNGIWEARSGPQRYLYSAVMCWAAVDRGVHMAEHYDLPAPVQVWKAAREEIRKAILTKGYDQKIGAFTQAFGVSDLDASALIIPRVGFLSPTDPRVKSTVRRIQQDLTNNGLVYRYRTSDGLPGGEGTFTLCSLWLVEALALGGELDEANDLFKRVLSYANDVGLLSEEINVKTGDLLGNFPQGFTHLGVIRSAVDLAKAAKHGPEHEPENEAERARRARAAARQG